MKSDIQLINENQLELVSGGTWLECLMCYCCGSWLLGLLGMVGHCGLKKANNRPLHPQNNQRTRELPDPNQITRIPYSHQH